MSLVLIHARAMTRELARYPAYVVPTLLFPTVFFLFFAVPGAEKFATIETAAFAGFAAIGVAFFQFGVGIATERASPWELYLRTLPVTVAERLDRELQRSTARRMLERAPVRQPEGGAPDHRRLEDRLQHQPTALEPQRAHTDRICNPPQPGPNPEQTLLINGGKLGSRSADIAYST